MRGLRGTAPGASGVRSGSGNSLNADTGRRPASKHSYDHRLLLGTSKNDTSPYLCHPFCNSQVFGKYTINGSYDGGRCQRTAVTSAYAFSCCRQPVNEIALENGSTFQVVAGAMRSSRCLR